MELADKIQACIANGAGLFELLDLFNLIKDKDMLAELNEEFMERQNETLHEMISDALKVDELYAISSTLKYIREPSQKNLKHRNKFYEKIGYVHSPLI